VLQYSCTCYGAACASMSAASASIVGASAHVVQLARTSGVTVRGADGLDPAALAAKLADRNRWIQVGLALEETIAVVAPYVDGVFRVAHANVLSTFPGGQVAAQALAASGPTLHSLKCPNKSHNKGGVAGCVVCSSVLHSVQRKPLADIFAAMHYNNNPHKVVWSNADASKWGEVGHHIEMAKLFSSTLGDHEHSILKTEFSQLDGTALFNMLYWCKACDPSLRMPSCDARDARNLWGHEGAANLALSQVDFDNIIQEYRNTHRWPSPAQPGYRCPAQDQRHRINPASAPHGP
jgi:hypothetical protein